MGERSAGDREGWGGLLKDRAFRNPRTRLRPLSAARLRLLALKAYPRAWLRFNGYGANCPSNWYQFGFSCRDPAHLRWWSRALLVGDHFRARRLPLPGARIGSRVIDARCRSGIIGLMETCVRSVAVKRSGRIDTRLPEVSMRDRRTNRYRPALDTLTRLPGGRVNSRPVSATELQPCAGSRNALSSVGSVSVGTVRSGGSGPGGPRPLL